MQTAGKKRRPRGLSEPRLYPLTKRPCLPAADSTAVRVSSCVEAAHWPHRSGFWLAEKNQASVCDRECVSHCGRSKSRGTASKCTRWNACLRERRSARFVDVTSAMSWSHTSERDWVVLEPSGSATLCERLAKTDKASPVVVSWRLVDASRRHGFQMVVLGG